jgi:hypothetical protein
MCSVKRVGTDKQNSGEFARGFNQANFSEKAWFKIIY